MYNLQSGLHRQSFPSSASNNRGSSQSSRNGSRMAAASRATETKHTKAVTGLMVDGLNRTVISCGLDGKVKVNCQSVNPPSIATD